MNTIDLQDLEVEIAPTGASDAVGGPVCVGLFVVLMLVPA